MPSLPQVCRLKACHARPAAAAGAQTPAGLPQPQLGIEGVCGVLSLSQGTPRPLLTPLRGPLCLPGEPERRKGSQSLTLKYSPNPGKRERGIMCVCCFSPRREIISNNLLQVQRELEMGWGIWKTPRAAPSFLPALPVLHSSIKTYTGAESKK